MKPINYICQRDLITGKLRFDNFVKINNIKLTQKEKKLLKVFLLTNLYKIFCRLIENVNKNFLTTSFVEQYIMDSRVVEFLINEILKTGYYTLEGIANYTKIPFDIIYDAACGNNKQLTISLWAKIVELYVQVNPKTARILFKHLLEIEDEKRPSLSALLNAL